MEIVVGVKDKGKEREITKAMVICYPFPFCKVYSSIHISSQDIKRSTHVQALGSKNSNVLHVQLFVLFLGFLSPRDPSKSVFKLPQS